MRFLGWLILVSVQNQVDSLNFCNQKTANMVKFRIIGGTAAGSDFNWMTKLISYGDNHEGMLCGATIIDNHWVLTAAHCANQFRIHSYVFIQQPANWFFDEREVKVTVDKYFIHPKYDNNTANNDIALLYTSTDFESKGISPVCLVKDDDSILEEYKEGLVIGYGQTLQNTTSPNVVELKASKTLQETTVPIITPEKCRTTWNYLSFRTVVISPNQLCAGAYLHGTAPGDSGGPLLVKTFDGQYIQIGITSFGADGLEGLIDQGRYPGVYTRVSKYIPWIQNVIENSASSFQPYISLVICITLIFVKN